MTTRTITLAIPTDRDGTPLRAAYVQVASGSTNPTRLTVTDVPANIPSHRVALHMGGIAMFPAPDMVRWADVADLPMGALVTRKSHPHLYA
jgi:hypothetical protein